MTATSFDKKSYGAHLKAYMGAIKAHLEKTNPERVTEFMKGAQTFAKRVLGKFDDYEFYTTESMVRSSESLAEIALARAQDDFSSSFRVNFFFRFFGFFFFLNPSS